VVSAEKDNASWRLILEDSVTIAWFAADIPGGTVSVREIYWDGRSSFWKPFLDNVRTAGSDADYCVKPLADGNFLVVWTGMEPDSSTNIYARMFDPFLRWIGIARRVSGDTRGNKYSPRLEIHRDTAYVAWFDERSGSRDIYLRKFHPDDVLHADAHPELPSDLSLSQNYPNPCERTTCISFHTMKAGTALLTVFDVFGRILYATECNDATMGERRVRLDTSHMPAGCYFYRVEAGDIRSPE